MAYYVRYENGDKSLMKKCVSYKSAINYANRFKKQGFKYIQVVGPNFIVKEGKFDI